MHHDDDPYKCAICGRWFVVPSLLNEHMDREHREERAA